MLTYIISTDGAPLFHISKRGFWPVQILLNFLPVHLRFKYVLLAGVMVLRSEPKPDLMNILIKRIAEQALRLKLLGIFINLPNNEKINFKFSPSSVVSDSKAKPFNGYCSCRYCYHLGQYIKEAGIRFPFFTETEPELRSHTSHMADVQFILTNGRHIPGVKGESAFFLIDINMVWGFPIDYMHNAILGVTEQDWILFKILYLLPAHRKEIDDLLMSIKPSRDLRVLPQKISETSIWKACHWKSWLLYYSPIILSSYLPQEVMQHYMLFVNSIFTLLKTEISAEELNKCEEDLLVFVANFQTLYGVSKMTYNVHILLHAVESVRMSGPFWATSAFPFESNIYSLKRRINGPKNVEQQMANKSLINLRYNLKPPNCNTSAEVTMYCKNLFSTKRITKSSLQIENVRLFGPSLKNKFQEKQEFERCCFNNCIFSSITYVRSKKFNDTVICLKNGKICQILKIYVELDKKVYFDVQEVVVEPFIVNEVTASHIFKIKKNVKHPKISVHEIKSKLVVVDVGKEKQYVCFIPNTIEAQ